MRDYWKDLALRSIRTLQQMRDMETIDVDEYQDAIAEIKKLLAN